MDRTSVEARAAAVSPVSRFPVDQPPQVPARHRAIRPKRLSQLVHAFGGWPLAKTIELRHAFLNSEISGRPHIEPTQMKHQEHLRRPLSDSVHLGQVLGDQRIRQAVEIGEGERARGYSRAEVAHRYDFLARETARP